MNTASLLASATDVAHRAAATLAPAQVQPGAKIPTAVPLKENSPSDTFTLDGLTGLNVFVGVPGAFTGTCSAQVPKYIELYDQFKAKGVKDVYVVAVNDVFVMQAWKEKLAPSGTPIRFIADDKGAFSGALGLIFDASPKLGAPRAKRYVVITQGTEVTHVAVEPVPSELTICAADKILPLV